MLAIPDPRYYVRGQQTVCIFGRTARIFVVAVRERLSGDVAR